MLACLARGNLLDVLQEGFNEVTARPSHSLLPSPSASRLISGAGRRPRSSSSRGPQNNSPAEPQMGFGGGGGADDTGEPREIKGAACLQLSWALTFPGSLPEPTDSEVISFQKRWCPLSPGILPRKFLSTWQ